MDRFLMTLFGLVLNGLLLFPACLPAQQVSLHFNPVLYGQSADFGSLSGHVNGDSITVHTLRFYLSNFVLYRNGKVTWRESNSYHLVDMEDESSMSIDLKTNPDIEFDQVEFDLGTDSLVNVSGVFGGDLDPTKGMYWAWNSGFINFKIEGYSDKCPSRKNTFQFHVGGYMPPFQTVQKIVIGGVVGAEIQVDIELSRFLEQIDFGKTFSVLTPSAEAAELAKLFAITFHLHEE